MRPYTPREARQLISMLELTCYSIDSKVELLCNHINLEKEEAYLAGKTRELIDSLHDTRFQNIPITNTSPIIK